MCKTPECCYVNHCNFVSESCSVHSRNKNLGDSFQHIVTPETLQRVCDFSNGFHVVSEQSNGF